MSARPGGWVPGIGWVAIEADVPTGSLITYYADETKLGDCVEPTSTTEICMVVRWPDGSTPSPSPVESEGERAVGSLASALPDTDEMPPANTYLADDRYSRCWIGPKWDLALEHDGRWHIWRKGNWKQVVGSEALAVAIVRDDEGYGPVAPTVSVPLPEWEALDERLRKAEAALTDLSIAGHVSGSERDRLAAKASGVALARSYVREAVAAADRGAAQ